VKDPVKLSRPSLEDLKELSEFYISMAHDKKEMGVKYDENDWCRFWATRGSHHFFIAKVEGKIVGMILWYDLRVWVYVDVLFVDPSFRRKGIGTKLWKTTNRTVFEVGVEACFDPYDQGVGEFLSSVGLDWPAGVTLWRSSPRREKA
jgi:GNAT superfamily N-acetyltransferase